MMISEEIPIRGRCVGREENAVLIRRQNPKTGAPETVRAPARNASAVALGDIVEIHAQEARVLTPNRSARPESLWCARTLDERRFQAVLIRARVECAIREFFIERGFLETRTPLLVPCPGMETHIRPFRVESQTGRSDALYLPTSPEFAMKRLLVGGLERIFQLCPSFRDEPRSSTHHPEFTMLEWYRAYAGYEDIMRDTEELFAFVALKVTGSTTIRFQGRAVRLAPPWPRLRVRDLFQELAGVDLARANTREALAAECERLGIGTRGLNGSPDGSQETWDDLYFKIWLNRIEPELPSDQAVFVTRYPRSQAALAVIDRDPDGTEWAKRFEIYAGGLELGNAFEELTDPVEQRRRFEKDMDRREQAYGPGFPRNALDEEFLSALTEGMPPSGGIAVGVDRMVMLMADEPEIERTLWIESATGSAKI